MATLSTNAAASTRSCAGCLAADPWIIAAMLLGALVRVWKFDAIPAGLHQDEASAAYDAYCLWNYGVDRNGFHNPVALVGWGSGMFALLSYSALPGIALIGLNSLAIRCPCLIAGVTSMAVFALMADKLHGRMAARTAAFLLAICPWHIFISRWGLDSNLLPTTFLIGVTGLLLAMDKPWLLPISCGWLSLSLYAYGTAYIAVPVFLAIVLPYLVYHRCWSWAPAAAGLLTALFVGLPAILYVVVNWWKWDSLVTPWFSIPHLPGVARFDTVGNFHVTDPLFIIRVFHNLWQAGTLLITQNDGQIWNDMPWFGVIYLFSLPLAIAGLYQLCRECLSREFRPAFLLLAWCATTLVVAALVRPNINRLNIGLIPLVYCTAWGVASLQPRWPRLFRGMIVLYAGSFVAFCWAYFMLYPTLAARAFNPGLVEAVRAASGDSDREVYVTKEVTLPYIFVLYANEIDPREFQASVEYLNPAGEFRLVSRFGRFRFVESLMGPGPKAYVFRADELPAWAAPHRQENFGDFVVVRTN